MDTSNIKASAPTDDKGRVYHLRLMKGDVPAYMILPGDPERTLIIAEEWTDVREIANNREFKTVIGKYNEVPIGTTSTGIGAASSEICIHELNSVGVHSCIRVGTTGCLAAEYDLGDLIIPAACIRKDGTSDSYIGPEYPAYADTTVVMALMQACENLGFRYGVGLTYTVGSFYIGQGRPLDDDKKGYWPSFAENIIPDLITAGVTNIEMEVSGQFVIGKLHEMRMGAILAVIANRATDKWGEVGGEKKSTIAASEAIRILKEWDDCGEISLKLTNKYRIRREI